MKTTIIYHFAICMLLISSWSCNNDKKVAQDLRLTLEQKIDSLALDSLPKSFEIPKKEATACILKYVGYIDMVQKSISENDSIKFPNSSTKLNYGAQVRLVELREVLRNANPADELWIMQAIMPDGNTELIFSLKSTSLKTTNEDTDGPWSFYDFTRPCPAACPELDDIDFLQKIAVNTNN